MDRSMTELRNVTCHIGSHSVTCHPTQVSAPRLNPSHAGRYSIYLPRRDGRLSWPCYSETQPPGVELATSRSRIQCPNHWATKLLQKFSGGFRLRPGRLPTTHSVDRPTHWNLRRGSNVSFPIIMQWFYPTPFFWPEAGLPSQKKPSAAPESNPYFRTNTIVGVATATCRKHLVSRCQWNERCWRAAAIIHNVALLPYQPTTLLCIPCYAYHA